MSDPIKAALVAACGYEPTPIELAAAYAVNVPGWVPWAFRKVGPGVMVTGAVCPPITRGPNKGQANFRRHDRATRRDVFVTPRMMAAAVERAAREAGDA